MTCKHFRENHAIYCNSPVFPHVPNVIEMELLCFKDFCECRFYSGEICAAEVCIEQEGRTDFELQALNAGWLRSKGMDGKPGWQQPERNNYTAPGEP